MHVRRCLKYVHQASCSRSMQREENQVSQNRNRPSIQSDGTYLGDGPVDTFQNPFLLLSRLVLLLPLSVLLLDLLDFGTADLTGSRIVSRSVTGEESVEPYPSLYANSWYVGRGSSSARATRSEMKSPTWWSRRNVPRSSTRT